MIALVPKFTKVEESKFLKYDRTETELDWNYPFDFCGSLYELEIVVKVMESIEDQLKIRKPNTFEFAGNLAIKKKGIAKERPYCLCMNEAVLTVITVNKVQEVYDTPIYDFKKDEEEESKSEEEDVLEIMNGYMKEGKTLDIEGYYSRQQFNSVHIGDFKLAKGQKKSTDPLVAVVMPVYNQHLYLKGAIDSVLGQSYKNLVLIIVNDGSTNCEVTAILDKYTTHNSNVMIHRLKSNQGVAHALNIGISIAKGLEGVTFIARMDSDDICMPNRIQIQVDFMLCNP